MSEFTCFFCHEPAVLIGYYSKWYSSGRDTIESPTFFCQACWDDKVKRNEIHAGRGGMDSVYCLTFTTIGKTSPKELSYKYLSMHGKELNGMANRTWRKMVYRIHYLNQPKKVVNA